MDFGFYNPKTGTLTTVTAPATTGVPTVISRDKLSESGVGKSSDGKPLFPGFDRAPTSAGITHPSRFTWTAYVRSDDVTGQSANVNSRFEQADDEFLTIVLNTFGDPKFREPLEAWEPQSGSLVTFPDATAEGSNSSISSSQKERRRMRPSLRMKTLRTKMSSPTTPLRIPPSLMRKEHRTSGSLDSAHIAKRE